jgi:hypothetical protein
MAAESERLEDGELGESRVRLDVALDRGAVSPGGTTFPEK